MTNSISKWKRAANALVLSAALGAGLGFVSCARELDFNHQQVKEAMKKSKIKEDPDNQYYSEKKS